MRVLIDECAPKELKTFLKKQGYETMTVQEVGWAGKQNGELLQLAETRFEVLVTVDTNLRYQQNFEGRSIAVVILAYSSNRLEDLRQYFHACASALDKIKPGEIVQLADTD